MKDTKKELVHHLSRLEGQLASVKKELLREDTDCEKASQTLKAASRSFATFRMSFVTCFLETKFLTAKQTSDSTYTSLLQVINS